MFGYFKFGRRAYSQFASWFKRCPIAILNQAMLYWAYHKTNLGS